jgi:hypothetical protein
MVSHRLSGIPSNPTRRRLSLARIPVARCYGFLVNETSRPEPLIAPNDATIVKWTGMAVVVLLLVLIFVMSGWVMAMLYLIGSFGTLMVCVGAESEQYRGVDADSKDA